MELFTPLNIIMVLVIGMTIYCARSFYVYSTLMTTTMEFALEVITLGYVKDHQRFDEQSDRLKKEYAWNQVLWLPLFYLTVILLLVLWLSLSIGMDSSSMIVLGAVCVSAIITRVITYDHYPRWMADWLVEMAQVINEKELSKVKTKLEQVGAKIDALTAKAETEKDLNAEDALMLYRLMIELKSLQTYQSQLTNTISSVRDYYDYTTKLDKKED